MVILKRAIKMDSFEKLSFGGCIGALTLGLTSLVGYITHIVVCIQDENWWLLIGGCLAAPVAIVHGIGCWFGAW